MRGNDEISQKEISDYRLRKWKREREHRKYGMIKRFKEWYAGGDMLKSNASRLQDSIFNVLVVLNVIVWVVIIARILQIIEFNTRGATQ